LSLRGLLSRASSVRDLFSPNENKVASATVHMRVALVVPDHRGHRLAYVAMLVRQARASSVDVIILGTQEGRESDEFTMHLSSYGELNWIAKSELPIRSLLKMAQQLNIDRIIFPDGDKIVSRLILSRLRSSVDIALLIMRPSPARGSLGRPRWAIKSAAIWVLRRRRVKAFNLTSSLKVDVRPYELSDPIDLAIDVPVASEESALFTIGVVGSITRRKNLPIIIEALGLSGQESRLIVAGRIDPDAARELADAIHRSGVGSEQIQIRNQLLTDRDLDLTVAEVDCVILAHSNEGPSGIMGRAAALGTKVLASGALSLKADAANWPDGAIWCELSSASIATAMREISARAKPSPLAVSNSKEFAAKLLGISNGPIE